MTEVVRLKGFKTDPVEGVVELLERRLEEAKRGEIRSVAVITVNKGDTVGTCWERGDGGTHLHQLTAGASYLLTRLSSIGAEE